MKILLMDMMQDGEDEQDGEDKEEDGDFIDSEYVVTEEQDDEYKEPSEVETDDYNTSDLDSLHKDKEDEDGKKRGLRQPKFKQYNKQHDLNV
ncbi:unnamed protein product [Prunus armeniaca]